MPHVYTVQCFWYPQFLMASQKTMADYRWPQSESKREGERERRREGGREGGRERGREMDETPTYPSIHSAWSLKTNDKATCCFHICFTSNLWPPTLWKCYKHQKFPTSGPSQNPTSQSDVSSKETCQSPADQEEVDLSCFHELFRVGEEVKPGYIRKWPVGARSHMHKKNK